MKLFNFPLILFPLFMYSQSGQIQSTLEIFDIETNERKIVLQEEAHFEAPNWSLDGSFFIINQNGLLYKVAVDGSKKELLPTGNLKNCNNDHGISFDGKLLAISNNDKIEGATSGTSRIYTMPISGGKPKLVTPDYPSYWHGWSPDGKTLVYTAKRNDNFDIFSISSDGGEEKRLTDSPGLDDGPEYSPNGQFIYYNSMQSGKMEIWRMKADGSIPQQLTDDSYSNWFAHPSPNGRYFVFISYLEDQGDRHPPMKKVALRLYDLDSGDIRTLCEFTGGQGTINVPSWAPDNRRFAFVSYEEIGN